MFKRLETYSPGQVGETRFERTNIGHAIEIDVQGKSIRLEFRDENALVFVDRLVQLANEHRESS